MPGKAEVAAAAGHAGAVLFLTASFGIRMAILARYAGGAGAGQRQAGLTSRSIRARDDAAVQGVKPCVRQGANLIRQGAGAGIAGRGPVVEHGGLPA